MKKSTLLLFVIALFSSVINAATVQVTTSVMDANTEGSLLNVITNAPEGTETIIEFNLPDENLQFSGTGISISNKILTFNGVNKINGKQVSIQGSNTLFSISGGSVVTLNKLKIGGFKTITIKISGGSTIKANGCTFENCFEDENSAKNNGGVARISSSNAMFINCIFKGNRGGGTYGGGALCAYGASDLHIENCSFIDNIAAHGGAIAVKGTGRKGEYAVPTTYIVNSTFANNMADGRAGAIYLQTEATSGVFKPAIVNCTFVGNLSAEEGGAICAWSRSETSMEPVLVNNLFAENYTNPWDKQQRNDMWVFYLEGALNTNNEPLPQTVFPTCKNNIYVSAIESLFSEKEGNKVIDFSSDDIFESIEKNPRDDGDNFYDHKTSALVGHLPVAMISQNSVAKQAGIASYNGVEIPTTDQLGNKRPSVPSVGAVEYSVLTAIKDEISNGQNVKVRTSGHILYVNGLSGVAEITIFDLTGRRVYQGQVENNRPVKISGSSKAIYIANIENDRTIETVKFMIK